VQGSSPAQLNPHGGLDFFTSAFQGIFPAFRMQEAQSSLPFPATQAYHTREEHMQDIDFMKFVKEIHLLYITISIQVCKIDY
jgi:hypothetical protein